MQRSSKKTTLIAVYRFPIPLGVTQGCLGNTFAVSIGGLAGRGSFPKFQWSDEGPQLVAPRLDERLLKAIEHYSQHEDVWVHHNYWGFIRSWNSAKRLLTAVGVTAVTLRFEVPRDAITFEFHPQAAGPPSGQPLDELFTGIDGWFDRLRTWLEVAIDQDADHRQPLSSSRTVGDGLMIFGSAETAWSLPRFPHELHVVVHREELLNLPRFRRAATRANAGQSPSEGHLLLRDARAAYRRTSFRRAAIDAGSAVEVTLAAFNRAVVGLSPSGGRPPTLGWYVNQGPLVDGVGQPSTVLQRDLVRIRNQAIHQNSSPTGAEAKRALDLAKQVVDARDPLPI
jgi:hypothetical protein